ncbi:hypothetical protein VTN02DRAFT_2147 [Thermoascus thermophilus]
MTATTWIPPSIGSRPVVLLGAGVLGRRIACCFVAAGYNVHIRDPSEEARKEAVDYIKSHVDEYSSFLPKKKDIRTYGQYTTFADIDSAVKDAWLVIEAVPEKLELKIATMGELDRKAPRDCIIGTNSSSYRSRYMLDDVSPQRRTQILNTHFFMPPAIRAVELMTDGETNPEIFPFLTRVLSDCGMLPVTARKECTGFIFNRLWAAVKREILLILSEGVSEPQEIDKLWEHMFKHGPPPCQLMDQIGLDTVAFIEDNYVAERHLDGSQTVDWLRENYIKEGRLGLKSDKGGLYPPMTTTTTTGNDEPSIYFLDVGLGDNLKQIENVSRNGRVLCRSANGTVTTLVSGQKLPDGIDISRSAGRIFWTNMGAKTSMNDGSVLSAKLDGSDIQTVIPEGKVHTPKQLVVDDVNRKLYFCDREGMGVHRSDFDGKNHEVLVQRGDHERQAEKGDMTRWCVGIAVDARAGKIYWTQKGPSKSGQGRIFRANIDIPAGETASDRSDIETLFEGLPEPIDLEIDPGSQTLYWTDRGEHPIGSSLNRANVGLNYSKSVQPEIVARHFHEPIGLKLDLARRQVYVTDLGGSVYQVNLDGGEKKVIHRDGGCYTGIAQA